MAFNGEDENSLLVRLEGLAQGMFGATDTAQRDAATKALVGFTSSRECLPQCRFLLERSRSQFALLLAAQSLVKTVTDFWNSFTAEDSLELSKFVLNYLAQGILEMPQVIVPYLVQVVCRVAKLGWLTDPSHKEIVQQIGSLLSMGTGNKSTAHYLLGLSLFTELVQELNTQLNSQTVMQHRKAAVSFRDLSLLDIFQTSINTLVQITEKTFPSDNLSDISKLKTASLKLALQCLNFDYIGTNPDEASDEFGALQVPSEWRSLIEDSKCTNLFFGLCYQANPMDASNCMEILVQLASCRRSLFSKEALRKLYLENFCAKTVVIIQDQRNYISDHSAYTHFCRLLLALKANYQLQELAKLEVYPQWINSVSSFTITSFNNWEWLGQTSFYLVWLWTKLTMSIPYVRDDVESFLGTCVPEVSSVYFETRLKAVQKAVREDSLEDIFSPGILEEHLQHLHTLCRHRYDRTYQLIQSVVEPLLAQYQDGLQIMQRNAGAQMPDEFKYHLALVENQIAWVIFAIGTIVSCQVTTGGTPRDEQIEIDSKLIAMVFTIARVVDFRISLVSQCTVPLCQYIDESILHFFQEFRRAHVGFDSYARGVRVLETYEEPEIYKKIGDSLGQPVTQNDVLSTMLQKIISILQTWATNTSIVEDALKLMSELSAGYSSAKLITGLQTAKALLKNHGPQYFSFMKHPPNFRLRTKFYLTWARMVFSEQHIDFFDELMEPFDQNLRSLYQLSMNSNVAGGAESEIKLQLVGFARDMRGVLMAIYNKSGFQLFYDWFFPEYFKVIINCFQRFLSDPDVTIPVLKFFAEIAHNKAQRIEFSSSSPNGIVLFKDISQVLYGYASTISSLMQRSDPALCYNIQKDSYRYFLKSLSLSMETLSHALRGSYVNFGIFPLYGDDCLTKALSSIIELTFCQSQLTRQITAFDKVANRYYQLLEVVFRNHIDALVELDHTVFSLLCNSLLDGLYNLDKNISTMSASAIDELASYQFLQAKRKKKDESFQKLELRMNENAENLRSMMTSIFVLILFEGVTNLWSFSRPLLSLILIQENHFAEFAQQLINSQSPQNQEEVREGFTRLMEGVKPVLENRNRDKFTQNLVYFSTSMKKIIVRPSGM